MSNKVNKARRNSHLDIPLDCWGVVIEFLEDQKDFISLSRSIRGIQQYLGKMCPSRTKNMQFKVIEFPTQPKLYSTNVFVGSLVVASIKTKNSAFDVVVSRKFPNLVKLNLCVDDDEFVMTTTSLPMIKELRIKSCHEEEYCELKIDWKNFPKLHILKLESMEVDLSLNDIKKQLSNISLTDCLLDVSEKKFFSDFEKLSTLTLKRHSLTNLDGIGPDLPNLEKLFCEFSIEDFEDGLPFDSISDLFSLKKIELSSYNYGEYESFRLKNLISLVEVVSSWCYLLYIDNCPNIKNLSMHGESMDWKFSNPKDCLSMEDVRFDGNHVDVMKCLDDFKNLKNFFFSTSSDNLNGDYLDLIGDMENLRDFDLDRFIAIKEIRNCPQLEKLQCGIHKKFDMSGIGHLKEFHMGWLSYSFKVHRTFKNITTSGTKIDCLKIGENRTNLIDFDQSHFRNIKKIIFRAYCQEFIRFDGKNEENSRLQEIDFISYFWEGSIVSIDNLPSLESILISCYTKRIFVNNCKNLKRVVLERVFKHDRSNQLFLIDLPSLVDLEMDSGFLSRKSTCIFKNISVKNLTLTNRGGTEKEVQEEIVVSNEKFPELEEITFVYSIYHYRESIEECVSRERKELLIISEISCSTLKTIVFIGELYKHLQIVKSFKNVNYDEVKVILKEGKEDEEKVVDVKSLRSFLDENKYPK